MLQTSRTNSNKEDALAFIKSQAQGTAEMGKADALAFIKAQQAAQQARQEKVQSKIQTAAPQTMTRPDLLRTTVPQDTVGPRNTIHASGQLALPITKTKEQEDLEAIQRRVDHLHDVMGGDDPREARRAEQELKALQPIYTRILTANQRASGIVPTGVTEDQVRAASTALDQAKGNALNASLRLGSALTAQGGNPYSAQNPELQAWVDRAKEESSAAYAAEQEAAARYNKLASDLQYQRYASLRGRDDFLINSGGNADDAKRWNAGSFDSAKRMYADVYNRGGQNVEDISNDPYNFIRDDERSIFFYLWNTEGQDAATEYIKSIQHLLNSRMAQQRQEDIAGIVDSSPVAAAGMSVASIALNQASIAGVVDLTVQNIRRMLGDTRPIDYNTPLQAPGQITQQIRSEVSKNLEERFPKAEIPGIVNLASFAYQTGMSIADSGTQLLLNRFGVPEPVTLSLMSGGAAQQAVYDAKARGASDGQALLTGYAAGIAEYAFEKISLDKLVGSIEAKAGETIGEKLTEKWTSNLAKKVGAGIINAGQQGLVEGSEEAFTTLANTVTDLMINGDKSELLKDIDEMGTGPALRKWITGLALDAMGGIISGVGMGAGGDVLRYAGGVAEDAASAARAAAEKESGQAQAETPAQPETRTAPPTPSESNPLAKALDKLRSGEQLTKNDARRIIEDEASMQTLRDAGLALDIRPGQDGSEQIRQAVESYARLNTDLLTQAQAQGNLETNTEEVVSNGRTVETPDRAAAETAGEQQPQTSFRERARAAAETQRSREILDREERRSGLGRFLAEYRANRAQRSAESQFDEQNRRANSLRNQAEARNLTFTSAAEQGVPGGSEDQTFQVMPADMLDRNMRKAQQEAAKNGIDLRFMIGQGRVNDSSGDYNFRGWISADGKRMLIQADHSKLTWQQILDHEELHKLIKSSPGYRQAVEDALLSDARLQPYLSSIVDRYAEAYNSLGVTDENEIIEELLADYRAGFDMLDIARGRAGDVRTKATAKKDIRAVEKRVQNNQPVSVSETAKASREYDSDYMAAAQKLNEASKHVPTSLMNDVAKVRETIKTKLAEIEEVANLPEDREGNTYFPNSSYSGSEENTTVCPRSVSVDALADAVGDALGRPLTVEESVYVAQQAFHFTDVPQCLYCYVAMDRMAKRQLLGEYINKRTQVLTDLQNGMSVSEALAAFKKRETAGGKQWSQNKQDRFNMWARNYESGVPSVRMSNLSSEAAVEKALADPNLKAEMEDALKYAQNASWAKKRVGYAAYNNHILKWDQSRIDALNTMFGLRLYSFSDYSPAYILENMQMVTDAAVRGLKMLAYTKELDFVRIFAGTGMNINVSTFGMDGGDGTVHEDAMQGASWKEAQELRKQFPNVGITFVATNDNQVNWALDQDWIDVVIPFHMVKTGATVAGILGYQNYTGESSDKKIQGVKARQKEIFPSQHQNDKQKYLDALQKARLTPRFERWLDHPNYMKLVNETRRSAQDTPAVQPKFDQEAVNAALKSLDDMVKRGGYGVPIGGTLENLADIALEMADELKKGVVQDLKERNKGKASREIDDEAYMAAVESGDMDTAQRMVDETAKAAGYTVKAWHGTRAFGFTKFDPGKSDDGISLFATSNPLTAETYSGKTERRRVKERSFANVYELHGKELISEAAKYNKRYQDYKLMSAKDKSKIREDERNAISWSIRRAQEFVGDHDGAFDKDKAYIMDRLISALYHLRDAETENDIEDAWSEWEDAVWDIKGIDDSIALEFLDDVDSRGLFMSKNRLSDMTYAGDMYVDDSYGSPDYIFDARLQLELDAELHKGIYELYGDPGKQLAIDTNGENWNSITPPKELRDYGLYGPQRTRDIASAAKALGYDSVLFKNLRDNGGETPYNGESDIYIFFNPKALKSADPVTYDDRGNVIHLSERFNTQDDDIRFSREIDPDTLSDLNEAEKNGDVIHLYRTMEVVEDEDGRKALRSPMADTVRRDPNAGKTPRTAGNIIFRSAPFGYVGENGDVYDIVDGEQTGASWIKADEHPETATMKPGAKWASTNIGKPVSGDNTGVAYNPYNHASNYVLNDQFKGAYERPNLVTVEVIVPRSEEDHPYHADMAKDPVGWADWKSGDVATALAKAGGEPRRLFLSRWMKVVRVLSDAEVADRIVNHDLKGTGIKIPANTVTPSLREALREIDPDIISEPQNPKSYYAYQSKIPSGNTSREIDPQEIAKAEYLTEQRRTGRPGGRGRKKVSRVRTHAFELGGLYNEVEAQMAETQPGEFTYDPVSEKRSMSEALGRLRKDFAGEAEKLASSDQWGGSDLDTAMGILYQYRQVGRDTGDYSLFNEWSHVIQQKGTKGGQFVQAFAKYSRTATERARKAAEDLREQAGKLTPAEQKRVQGHVDELLGAIDEAAEEAAREAVEGQKGLRLPTAQDDSQKTKDALNIIKEIHNIFALRNSKSHGVPVENWTKETGDQLASRIASRLRDPSSKTKTTMQTILDDLVTFAQEHALPTQEARQHRTALDRITDYLNNRNAYGEAWNEAKQVLRDMYADDEEKLDALESFLNATISYNGEDFDRTMYRAILEASDLLGISKQDILNLAAVGTTDSVVDRIADEFIKRVGTNDETLRDTVRRHITSLVMEGNVGHRLERMENEAGKALDIKLQELLRESRRTKADAANRIAQYLINDLGISGTDAAIAANHIAGHYMDRLAQKANQTLQRMFEAKGEKLKPKQRDKLMDLIRLGGLTNANVEDAVVDALGLNKLSRARQREITTTMAQFADTLDAIEDNDLEGLRSLIRQQAAARNTKLDRLAEKVLSGETDVEYLRNLAKAQLDLIAADYKPRTAGEKISTVQIISHLLNARTAMRNLTSNQVFDMVDSLANNVGLLPDIIMGAITGQRSVGLNKSWASQQKRQGALQGAGRNLLEIALDAAPNDRNQSKYGTGGRRTFAMASSGTVGKILSQAERILGYELNTTDEFHKGSVYGETMESLARFVDRGDMTVEQAAEFATDMALYRSFQDSTVIGSILGGLKDVLNIIGTGTTNGKTIKGLPVHDFGLGDLVVKYTQVPGALIHRAIEFSPVGYLKAIYNIAQLGNLKSKGESTLAKQRAAALSIGRATTGTGLITLFALLAKAGLLRRKDDEKDKNAAALRQSQGFNGTQLNVSALGRMLSGGSLDVQEGDVLADIGFLEPLDSLMTIAALAVNDPEIKAMDLYDMFRNLKTAGKMGEKSLQGIWLALEDTSAMQTLSNIYSTVRYHDEANDLPLYMQIPMEIAASSVSGFIPAPIRQIAQATDTVYRDQYRSQNLLEQTAAKVANAIPGVRQQLAPKLTPLGEEKAYQAPALNDLNALLSPGNISVYHSTAVTDEFLRVYDETGEAKILPERNAPYSITINKEKYTLTPDERTQYQRTRGQLTDQMMAEVMNADWYSGMDGAQKADVLNWIGNYANYVAKVEFSEGRGMDYASNTYDKYYQAMLSGTSLEDVVASAKGKIVEPAKQTVAAEATIAAANIPEASKEEAQTMSAEAKRLYADFLKGGVSDSTAKDLATKLEGSTATGHEQWREVYNAAGKEGEKAVTSVMDDDMKRNWQLAKNVGVSMDDYIKVREGFKDLNGNGKKTQDEWNATLDSFTFSTNADKDKQIKGALWQILTGSNSTKNNPYDKEAGQKVIDGKTAGGSSGTGKTYAPANLSGLKLPTVETTRRMDSGLRLPTVDTTTTRPSSGLKLPTK